MPDSHLPELTLLIVAAALVAVAGLFAMTEASLSSVSRARSAEIAREGVRGARALEAIASDLVRHLNLLLLLRMLCEFGATTLVALVTIDQFGAGWRAALITAGSMTVIMFVAVGVGPRTIGRQHAYTVGRSAAPLVRWLGRVLNPLASLLILVGNAFTPGKGFREGPFATQVELQELVDLAEQRGLVEHGERDMIHSVFALGDTIAREVMVPRTDMVFLDGDATIRQGLKLAMRSGFSRLPLVGETVDDVLGIVYLKDLIKATEAGLHETSAARDLMREPTFVPESKPVDDLLREMQAHRVHMAIIVDEYGGTAGLVTIEDILEEIVGEIADEYDGDEKPPIVRLDGGAVRVTARLSVEDLAEVFDVEIDGDEVETVGGLLAQALGRVPIPGAEATIGALRLRAEGTTGRRNRIDTVLIWRDEAEVPPHETASPRQERQHADV